MQETKLEKFKLVAIAYITPRMAEMFGETPEIDVQQEALYENILTRVKQAVWGRETQRQECKWPADWWQAFKERWFPAWVLKRWPVQYTEYVLRARELYPDVAMPHRSPIVVIDKLG